MREKIIELLYDENVRSDCGVERLADEICAIRSVKWVPITENLSEDCKEKKMYECFHCCTQSVIWDADFTFEDFGYDGDGIVQICHCAHCGAEIEYRIRVGGEGE